MADFMLARWAKLYKLTDAEKALEPALARRGYCYRVQHPIWALGYFLDFALPQHKIAIEVDDESHRTKAKKAADAKRTARLARAGWTVVRCTNEDALTDPDGTVSRLLQAAGLQLQKD